MNEKQQESFEEKRSKRKDFFAKAKQELEISQNELQKKKLSLHTSFDMTYNEPGSCQTLNETMQRRTRFPKSCAQRNSSQSNQILGNGEKSGSVEKRGLNGTMNLENTFELNKIEDIWGFEGTSKATSQSTIPNKKATEKYLWLNPDKEQKDTLTQYHFDRKEHQRILDKELTNLEARMIDLFQKEKESLLKENKGQMRTMEAKIEEKYTTIIKDLLEGKKKDGIENNVQTEQKKNENTKRPKPVPHRCSPAPAQGKNCSPPQKAKKSSQKDTKLQNASLEESNMDDKEQFEGVMKEIKLNVHPDYAEPYKPKTPSALGENEDSSTKFENLEIENETLRKRVKLLEWVLKAETEKNSGFETFEKPNYDKFITPKLKDKINRMATPKNKEDQTKQEKEICSKKEPPEVKESGIRTINPLEDKDSYILELKKQISTLNQKVSELTGINESLVKKNASLQSKFNTREEELLTSGLENYVSSKEIKNSEFWKKKCEVLVSKYFDVVKKLKEDNRSLENELKFDHKQFKKTIIASLAQIQKEYQNV